MHIINCNISLYYNCYIELENLLKKINNIDYVLVPNNI